MALHVLNIFAIRKCNELGTEWVKKKNLHLIIRVHFSLQVTVMLCLLFLIGFFCIIVKNYERIQVEQIAFKGFKKNLNEMDFTESFDDSFKMHYLFYFVPCIFLTK